MIIVRAIAEADVVALEDGKLYAISRYRSAASFTRDAIISLVVLSGAQHSDERGRT